MWSCHLYPDMNVTVLWFHIHRIVLHRPYRFMDSHMCIYTFHIYAHTRIRVIYRVEGI